MKIKIGFLLAIIIVNMSCHSRPITASNEIEIQPQPFTVTLVAAGDNLYHDSTIRSALAGNVYNFAPVYSEIKSIVENADLAFINQETVMAGTRFGYSGYPSFNTPQALAYGLVETGFNILNLANNHAMDMGAAGLYATLDFLDTIEEFTVIGARREGESARIIIKNNITFGFLAYTFSLNGIPLPRNNPNLVSMINRETMAQEIEALRPLCDFLIVSVHWGEEYRLEPDRDQTSLALFLAEQNVDLIIGHHPHVLQKAETITLPDGRKTLCYYSLGNFVSHQRERERIIGGMMVVTFTKDDTTGELNISDHGMLPIVTHFDRNFRNTKVYPLYSYTEELLETHALKRFDAALSMDFFNTVLNRLQTKVYTQNPFID
ncbi:MAG: CapA family protein [Treponema sp.]|nr:CapA family protein [Treponema sp.]